MTIEVMQDDEELAALRAEVEQLRELLSDAIALIGHSMPMDSIALVAGKTLVAREVWEAGRNAIFPNLLSQPRAELDAWLQHEIDHGHAPDGQPADNRPVQCRERLRDEGKAYPRSRCAACSPNEIFKGRCERKRSQFP